jgi:hypothetical protein
MLPNKARALLRAAAVRNDIREDFFVDREIIRRQREASYTDMWQLARGNKWYHIEFDDLSIFQFQNAPSPSYHFIDCPIDIPTLHDFLVSRGLNYRDRYNAAVAEEYQDVIETAPLKAHVCPIRYDYDANGYEEGIHPAAHIHIGLDNEIRLRMRREMSPLSFIYFVLRQRYPDNWRKVLTSPMHEGISHQLREGLPLVGAAYCRKLDICELELS